jgi:hypothetical protein
VWGQYVVATTAKSTTILSLLPKPTLLPHAAR